MKKEEIIKKTVDGIHNHKTAPLSDLEMKMVYAIPEGGNWKNVPEDIDSDRIKQIRVSGGRSTYYGRLRWNRPAYTISTYFSRTGNGCFIHPEQHRLISLREGARLQSFPDRFIFYGTKTSMYHQIGNAVPPLMARAIGEVVKPKGFVDLFCGAGGFSFGMEWSGGDCELAIDFDKHCCDTYSKNHVNGKDIVLNADIRSLDLKDVFSTLNKIDLVIGGPPCQGFSTAGKCALNDPRNELVKYFIKSVDIIQPKIFIMENVKGLTYFKNGEIVKEIYNEFKKIGYSLQHNVLLAADYGVPQRRERVFFIGSKDCERIIFPRPMFSEDGLTLPQYISVRESISDLPPLEVGGGNMEEMPYKAPISEYQLLMRGAISYEEFYSMKIKSCIEESQTNKRKGYITLDKF